AGWIVPGLRRAGRGRQGEAPLRPDGPHQLVHRRAAQQVDLVAANAPRELRGRVRGGSPDGPMDQVPFGHEEVGEMAAGESIDAGDKDDPPPSVRRPVTPSPGAVARRLLPPAGPPCPYAPRGGADRSGD